MALAPDTVLQNRYRVVRQLGQGGMGTVYEAIDLRFDNQVALKETHFTDEALRKQFEREARLLNRLRHPALARVIDHFTENDGQYLVMDFIEGEDLWEMQQKRGAAFPVDDVLKWANQLIDALDYLHSQEPPVIHRDIKPQNLKVTGRGQIILLDFGLAKGFAGQISRVTTSGSIFGYTPNYAPLEQIHGTGTDARSDLYSLAATLYHLLTNKIPPDALSRAMALTSENPDPLQPADKINKEVPTSVAEVLQRAMAINPAKRPESAAAMRAMLENVKQRQAPASSQLNETMLPQTMASPILKDQQHPYLPPTVASPSPNRVKKIEKPIAYNKEAAWENLERKLNKNKLGQPPVNPVRKGKPIRWIVSGVLVLVALSIILVYNFREGEPNSNTQPTQVNSSSTQAEPSLKGQVKNQSGKGIPDAFVTLAKTGDRLRTTATTSTDGTYRFIGLAQGEYTVVASKPQWNLSTPEQTINITNSTTTLDFTIK